MTRLLALSVALAGLPLTALAQAPVTTAAELRDAIAAAGPGTEIVMADGEWSDVRIRFVGMGTADEPITLRAETPGGVVLGGASDLWLAGEHLVVDGLHFRDGAAPGGAVIQFAVSDDSLANHSRVTNCAVVGYNKPQRDQTDLWVRFRGRHNALDRCYLAGKSNRGPTVRVDLEGTPSAFNYHRITNNHFGPRPPKGGPSAETLQIGDSSTSMTPSHTLVADNLFDRCDGEVEVISSKSNFNEFRDNVFYRSEGSLVTRHGAYVTVDGNVFIGDRVNPYYGGIRLIGTGHWVTNNYFFGLRGTEFRAPLALMNGIYRSSINRYFQVTDVVVAHNTWVDTDSPWQVGVGSNVEQAEVLPPSEIRDQTPVRTLLANNVIYNREGDDTPILRVDSIDGIDFRSNVIDNRGVPFDGVEGLLERDLSFAEVADDVWVPASGLAPVEVYDGFEFDRISHDVFGQPRGERDAVGATNGTVPEAVGFLDRSRYGPAWYDAEAAPPGAPRTLSVRTVDELARAIAGAGRGDVVELAPGEYEIGSSLAITTDVTVRAAEQGDRPVIRYAGGAGTPAFEMNPGGHLRLAHVVLEGDGETVAFAPLRSGMSSLYGLEVEGSEIAGFDTVLKAHKHSFADVVRFERAVIRDVANGLDLAAEDDDRGDYNAETVSVIDSRFENVRANVIDYYRGGYDESTVGGTLVVRGSTFTDSGADEGEVLIGTYGIINVEITGNTFRDNDVELVARLWGAKNNAHADNTVEDSGEIVVEQNLPLRLVY